MPERRQDMPVEQFTVLVVAAQANCRPMYFLNPLFQVLPDRLLRSCCQLPLLLFVQCCLQLLLHLPARFAVERLALAPFQCDTGRPPAILPLENGAFTVSTSCHRICLFHSLV